jgi:hypothetical protein
MAVTHWGTHTHTHTHNIYVLLSLLIYPSDRGCNVPNYLHDYMTSHIRRQYFFFCITLITFSGGNKLHEFTTE